MKIFAGLIFAMVTFLSILWAQPENININNPSTYKIDQRPAVFFAHESHMEEHECTDCHHQYKNGVNVLDETVLEDGNKDVLCKACHDGGSRIGLMDAYHRKCMGCHKKKIRKSEKPGPRMCGQCHVWGKDGVLE